MTNPFKDWKPGDVHAHNAKVAMRTAKAHGSGLLGEVEFQSGHVAPLGPEIIESESKLHRQILDECSRRGWLVFHGSMATSTHRTKGEPDFILCADRGRVFFIECKSAKGKLSPAQQAIHAWAWKLEHRVWVVRSVGEFMGVVGE